MRWLIAFRIGTNRLQEAVPQVPFSDTSFEEASEFGEPKGIRPPKEYSLLGFTFKDFDLATRLTWKFLRDADARQVRAQTDQALNGDERLVTGSILKRLFNPTPAPTPLGTLATVCGITTAWYRPVQRANLLGHPPITL